MRKSINVSDRRHALPYKSKEKLDSITLNDKCSIFIQELIYRGISFSTVNNAEREIASQKSHLSSSPCRNMLFFK